MKTKIFKRAMSLILAFAIILSIIIPVLPMVAHAAMDIVTDEAQGVVVTNYTIANGKTEINKGDTVDITLNIIDNRVTYDTAVISTDYSIDVKMVEGSFSGGTVTKVTATNDVGKNSAGKKIMGFTVAITGATYSGTGKDLAFEIGYLNAANVPMMGYKKVTQVVSEAKETATPKPDAGNVIDSSRPVYVANYVVLDEAGNEVTTINPGQNIMIALNIVDERIMHSVGKQPRTVRARMSQGAFITSNAEDVSYTIRDLASGTTKIPFQYSVVFRQVQYQGGVPEISFDLSYPSDTNIPISLPNAVLKQTITQAVDDIPEPKVILNSANFGGVAIIGQDFTLSTVATNTSDFVSLDNVSVRVELPKGISMASGNSQVLIGSVSKKGQISHNFKLVVTGAENDATSLPVKLFYEFEAYVKGARKTYVTEQDISIAIEQPTKFDISKLTFMETVNAGEEASISASLVNKGKTTISNVTAEIKSDKVSGTQTTFVGNVLPGSEATAEIYFPVTEAGTIKGKIVITYEDTKGKSSTIEKDFSMEAMEPIANPDGWDIPTDIPEEPKKSMLPWLIGVLVLAAGGAGAFVVVKKRKQAQKLEDEDEDI